MSGRHGKGKARQDKKCHEIWASQQVTENCVFLLVSKVFCDEVTSKNPQILEFVELHPQTHIDGPLAMGHGIWIIALGYVSVCLHVCSLWAWA